MNSSVLLYAHLPKNMCHIKLITIIPEVVISLHNSDENGANLSAEYTVEVSMSGHV